MRITPAALLVASLAPLADLAAQHGPPPPSDWGVTLGAGAVVAPDYAGAEGHRVLPFPLAEVTYRNRLYLGPSTAGGYGGAIGGYLVRTPETGVALEFGVGENRPADRAAALAGMADRDVVATVGASLSQQLGAFQATFGVAQGLNDDAGLMGTAGLAYSRPLTQSFIVNLGLGATVATGRQMRREFGVTEEESLVRQALIDAGDPRLRADEGRAYSPDGGIRDLGGSVSLIYLLNSRWSILGMGGVSYFGDEAAESPLVRQREQVWGGLGLVWRM